MLAECVYGLEAPPVVPLRAYVLRPDGTMTRTRAGSRDAPDMETEAATIGAERFREIARRFDADFFVDPPRPTPDANGLIRIGEGHITDTREPHLAVRRAEVWKIRQVWQLYHVARYGALMSLIYDMGEDPALGWRPAPVQTNAFALCKPDVNVGPP